MEELELINSIDTLISEIKKCINTAGIDKDSSEFQVLTELFLYKFLNDKFKHEAKKHCLKLAEAKDYDSAFKKLSDSEYQELLLGLDESTAVINKNQTISYLYSQQEYLDKDGHNFAWLFDKTLVDIGNQNVDIFSVLTENNNKIKLFEGVCKNIIDENKRNGFAKAVINKLINADNFENVFAEKYDFFSTIFEHLISEYNSNGGGSNAEYYTPKSIAHFGKILVNEPVQNVEVCDPTAGSGTLLMAIAHEIGEDKCTIYSQDLTQKSVKLLRLNLILNNLTHSLPNVKQADILEYPQFLNDSGNNLRQFDFIVSNPPFKTDFSTSRDKCISDSHIRVINGKEQKRFFAGVPNIPNADKNKMPIYLMVLQHILYSLKDNGKAGIVVPTKFLDWTDKIARAIRQYLIDNKFLRAVVSMPPNVFANTGTSVSVLFIDKSKVNEEVFLFDASEMGRSETIKINNKKLKKTILDEKDQEYIISSINGKKVEKGKSVCESIEKIKEKKYSLVAGQYFDIEIEHENLTKDQFDERMAQYDIELRNLFKKSNDIQDELLEQMKKVKYHE